MQVYQYSQRRCQDFNLLWGGGGGGGGGGGEVRFAWNFPTQRFYLILRRLRGATMVGAEQNVWKFEVSRYLGPEALCEAK
jgi:hypothetical protein